MLRKERIFLFLVLLLAIIRGSSYIFIKNIIDTQSPFEIIFFRFFLTGIILLIFYIKEFKSLNYYDLIFGLLAGIFLFSAFAFQTYGLKYTTVSKQSFLTSLYIVIIPLLDFIFFKNFEFSLNFGDILTILCALGFALNILLFSKIKKFNINVINITIIQMLAIGVLAFIFQIIFEKKVINFSMNFSLIYLILICTMLNFTIQNISQKYVPAHIMGLILSLEAIFGTVFAIIFLKETISQNFIIGTFLIAIAVILIQYFENKRGD